jgi:RNA polymerase sigma factor (sigma-70 family)
LSQNKNENISQSIINGCKENDSKSQRLLYDMTVNKLYNVVYRVVADHHYTQDILQESFVKIFNKINQYNDERGNIYGWMCKICINNSINFLRGKKIKFDDGDQLILLPEKDTTALENMEAEYILNHLEMLPAQQRIIFNLYEIEGYNHNEIAALLNINVNSCRAYLSRAKVKLQELINQEQSIYKIKIVP